MFRMISRVRLGVWLGTMVAALLAAVGFAQGSPPGLQTPRSVIAPRVPEMEPAATEDNPGAAAEEAFVNPALDCGGMENAFWTFTSSIVSGKLRLRLDSREPVDAWPLRPTTRRGPAAAPSSTSKAPW